MKYSVIIPCFNAEKYIDQAFSSVINQTIAPNEIILVDNCSTDNTLEKIKFYSSKYKNVLHVTENMQGASFARNAGLQLATGDYIQFLDVDDCLAPNKVKIQLQLIQNSNDIIDVLFDNYFLQSFKKEKSLVSVDKDDVWLGLLNGKLGFTSSNLWRKEMLLKVNGFGVNHKTSEEYHLIFKILKNGGKFLCASTALTFKREINPNSLTKLTINQNYERYAKLRYDIFKYMQLNKVPLTNKHFLSFFDVVRILYPLSKNDSIFYYNEILKNKFKLLPTLSTSKFYVFLYRFVGFRKTEFLRSLIKNRWFI